MPSKQLTLGSRRLAAHKAIVTPDFESKTVLVGDTWDYITMWLKRRPGTEHAQFYWEQARNFYNATRLLPKTSSPVTSYYCLLNATKTLLVVKGVQFAEQHGVTGKTISLKASLTNEIATFLTSGILAGLCQYLGEPITPNAGYSLKDMFYNLPYIHRAYTLTYESRPEIFVPLASTGFVIKSGSSEAWFNAQITDPRYTNARTVDKLPPGYEKDEGATDRFVIRKTNRFAWYRGKSHYAGNIERLTTYHKKVRQDLFYIHGPMRLWYIKRRDGQEGILNRSSLTLTFAAMHRLSEIARYTPMLLARHFDSQHNWLLSEFISLALDHFLDEISSEVTGQEFMIPGTRMV